MEQNIGEFRKAAVTEHNRLRELHSGAGLRSAPDLDRSAQDWAEKLSKMDKLENSSLSKRGEVGESISLRSSSDKHVTITGEEVTKQWYKDIEKYDYAKGLGQGGNFTQLVWLGTREVGFGRANVDGKVIVVAHYRPAGNVRGRYTDNVKPPKTSASASAVEAAGGARSPTATPELEGYRVRSRQIDKEERRENGEVYIVEIETVEYEDQAGNKKQKIIERRQKKVESSKDSPTHSRDSSPEPEGASDKTDAKKKDKNLKKFVRDIIDSHNVKRKQHNAKPLKKNKELNALAQAFAEELSSKEKLHNSSTTYKGDRLGENIASKWSNGPIDYTGEQVTEHWYKENAKFDFTVEPSAVQGVGNFTQMVWKNSKEIGVGKAVYKTKVGSYKVVVVCYYYPAGNVLECFKDNVNPPNSK